MMLLFKTRKRQDIKKIGHDPFRVRKKQESQLARLAEMHEITRASFIRKNTTGRQRVEHKVLGVKAICCKTFVDCCSNDTVTIAN